MTMISRYAFFFNSSACSGCKACQMACKDKNNLGPGVLWRKVYEITGGKWRREGEIWIPGVFAYNLSLACNHCENPACMKSCPTKAIEKGPDGIVLLNSRACIGCRYCEWSCPYGSPRYDPGRGIVSKCDFCYDLIDKGEKPACVAACPLRALDYGELEELKQKYGGTDVLFPLPNPSPIGPSLLIRPHRSAAQAGEQQASVANNEEI